MTIQQLLPETHVSANYSVTAVAPDLGRATYIPPHTRDLQPLENVSKLVATPWYNSLS